MLTCPGRKTNETAGSTMQIFWEEPTYKDNCGVYPNCTIKKISNTASGSHFSILSSPYTVRYEARDPSGNVNKECSFQVIIKKKPSIILIIKTVSTKLSLFRSSQTLSLFQNKTMISY